MANSSLRNDGESDNEKYSGDDERSSRHPLMNVLSMSGGDGENSYSSNSILQRKVLSRAKPILVKNTKGMMIDLNFPKCIRIADLGCASGQNTFLSMSEIVDTINMLCEMCNEKPPEIECYLNDLPENDFNTTFKLITFFNMMVKSKGSCFVSGVPGSFYSRIFPCKSIHFLHSSCSLHWLSKVPEGLEENISSVYLTTSSPPSVYKAYLNQFQRDFTAFLKMRSEEMVSNGRMVLTIIGRDTDDPSYRDCCHFWTLLNKSLHDLVFEGHVSALKVESFNVPIYESSREEVEEIIRNEGSFEINDFEIRGFDFNQSNHDEEGDMLHLQRSKPGEKEAKFFRAVSESILVAQFGDEIIDALFNKFAYHVSQHASCMKKTTATLVVSLIRK